MTGEESYEARFGPAAARQFRKLSAAEQKQVRTALTKTCAILAKPGARGGKSLKKIEGRHDSFYRLRVGDLRVVFDVDQVGRLVLVAGIVNRRDLDRWLRSS